MKENDTLEATPVASAKELKDQKRPKAKPISVGAGVHLRGYQAARKVDNAAIGAVVHLRGETELLLYVEKQCEQAEEVVVVYEAGPLGYGLYRKLTARGVKCLVCAPDSGQQRRKRRMSQGFGSWKHWWRPQALSRLKELLPAWLFEMLQT